MRKKSKGISPRRKYILQLHGRSIVEGMVSQLPVGREFKYENLVGKIKSQSHLATITQYDNIKNVIAELIRLGKIKRTGWGKFRVQAEFSTIPIHYKWDEECRRIFREQKKEEMRKRLEEAKQRLLEGKTQ